MRLKFANFFITTLIIALFTFIYWKLYNEPLTGVDDANIYFVYAKNIIEGHGFVYNSGSERVEGFTSLLWTIITIIAYFITGNFEVLLLIINVLIISYTLFLAINLINKLVNAKRFLSPAAIIFLSFIILIPGYIEWSVLALMETGLWSLLLVLLSVQVITYVLYDRISFWTFNIAIFLLIITRPESIFWGIFFILSLFLINKYKKNQLPRSKKLVRYSLITYFLSLAGFTIFRLLYFGYPLPNTYYAKVSGSLINNLQSGVSYFLKSCVKTPTLWLILIASLISIGLVVIKLIKHRNKTISNYDLSQSFVSVLTLFSIAIPVFLGGDHFNFLRFYQPFFPVYYFLFFNIFFWKAHLFSNIYYKINNPFPGYLLALVIIPYIYLNSSYHLFSFKETDSPLKIEFDIAKAGRENGKKFNRIFNRIELPSVGISEAGGFGYRYKGKSFDLLGLNSVQVAHANDKTLTGVKNHAAFSKSTFYQQTPDIFFAHSYISYFANDIFENNDVELKHSFANKIYDNLFYEPEFNMLYKKVLIHDPETGLSLITFCHKDFIDRLRNNHYKIYHRQI